MQLVNRLVQMGLLARVGSYYHDIGKTIRPGFFIENQHAGTKST